MSDLKTLYLIRHAESMENERLASLTRSLSTVSRFSLPSKSDLYRSVQLLNVPAQVDSEVSSIGWDQVRLSFRRDAVQFYCACVAGWVVSILQHMMYHALAWRRKALTFSRLDSSNALVGISHLYNQPPADQPGW